MDIQNEVRRIDAEIVTRASGNVGIKMGSGLYRVLRKATYITDEVFGVSGTEIFKETRFAYKKKFAVCVDPEMPDEAFDVGVPDS